MNVAFIIACWAIPVIVFVMCYFHWHGKRWIEHVIAVYNGRSYLTGQVPNIINFNEGYQALLRSRRDHQCRFGDRHERISERVFLFYDEDIEEMRAVISTDKRILTAPLTRHDLSYIKQAIGHGDDPEDTYINYVEMTVSIEEMSESLVKEEIRCVSANQLKNVWGGFPAESRDSSIEVMFAKDSLETDPTKWVRGKTRLPGTVAATILDQQSEFYDFANQRQVLDLTHMGTIGETN